jgi:hypothetical protein
MYIVVCKFVVRQAATRLYVALGEGSSFASCIPDLQAWTLAFTATKAEPSPSRGSTDSPYKVSIAYLIRLASRTLI